MAIADLFDADFYKSLYADFVSDIDDPLLHYVLIGWRAGLRPHPLLDVLFYRRQMGAAQAIRSCILSSRARRPGHPFPCSTPTSTARPSSAMRRKSPTRCCIT